MQSRICKHCNKEKRLSDFYCHNKHVYTTCIKCINDLRKIKRELQIKKENEKKQKEQEKKLLLKNKNLKGAYKLYYDYFYSCQKTRYNNNINIRLAKKDALQDLKTEFKLNPKFASSLLENEFKGKGILEIDYENSYIRSKI